MDMNTFFERQHSARAERSDKVRDARDTWTADRAKEIVEALAGMTTSGRAVYPSTLMVKPNGSRTVAGQASVSVFAEFGFWLDMNGHLLTGPSTRDLLTNPIRTEIKLLWKFADEHAELECGMLSDEFFDDNDWEAA
jgi:hypothetical protein